MKKISFNAKPSNVPLTVNVDAWVENRPMEEVKPREPMKRLTIDVPLSLHKRIKSECAMENLVMADEIRLLLEKRFPEKTPILPDSGRGSDPVNTDNRIYDDTEKRVRDATTSRG